MPERHTGQNICDRLKTVVNEWCREDCISSVVHDNASNAVCGLELTGLPQFGCVAHTLQLCVNCGLEISAISRMTSVCRKIVGHFKHSVVATVSQGETESVRHSITF